MLSSCAIYGADCSADFGETLSIHTMIYHDMKQLSVLVEDDILEAIENRIKASGRNKSDVIRELLVIGLKKPPTSAYRDLINNAIAEHERKYHLKEKI